MKTYAIYDVITYKVLTATCSHRQALTEAKRLRNGFIREYRHLTRKQALALPYAKAVDFESTLKECL